MNFGLVQIRYNYTYVILSEAEDFKYLRFAQNDNQKAILY